MTAKIPDTERRQKIEPQARSNDWRLWSRSKFVQLTLAAIVLIGLALLMIARPSSETAADIVELSGRIESPETRIGVTYPGRVKTIVVKEGDWVAKDEVLLTIDNDQKESKTVSENAGLNAALKSRQRAMQQLNAARRAAAAAREKKRGFFGTLFSPFTGAKRKEAQTKAQLVSQIFRAQSAVAQADKAVSDARAKRKLVRTSKGDERITSPIEGVCIVRSINQGEVVAPGQTLMTLVNPREAYMRGYVPESQLGKIRIGQKVDVFIDSDPDVPLRGRVTSIDTVASFTPENVYMKEDRVKQVFGVKINIDNRSEQAKPGMPADARIILSKAEPSR